MKIAVLSDIHSNPGALASVLKDAGGEAAEAFWIAGDTFGYGAGAGETWELLSSVNCKLAVLGNHDQWVLKPDLSPAAVGAGARANAAELSEAYPEALAWLAGLPQVARVTCNGTLVTMAHGTPTDPMNGRYYPDDEGEYPWLPGPGEILVLGQTHYPILRGTAETGLMLNPGSVGQPRDGDPRPSWALLDTETGTAELRRCQA